MSTVDTIREIADSFAPEFDLEVFDVEFSGGILRITADRVDKADPKAGAAISMLQKLSKRIAHVIEEKDLISSAFTLEVSSPGLERKLRTPDHFQRSVGEKIKVKTFPGYQGDRRNEGTLVSADDDGIELAVDNNTNIAIRFDQIAKATTIFDWGPQEKPGSGDNKKTSKTSKTNSAITTSTSSDKPDMSEKTEDKKDREKRAAS